MYSAAAEAVMRVLLASICRKTSSLLSSVTSLSTSLQERFGVMVSHARAAIAMRVLASLYSSSFAGGWVFSTTASRIIAAWMCSGKCFIRA